MGEFFSEVVDKMLGMINTRMKFEENQWRDIKTDWISKSF